MAGAAKLQHGAIHEAVLTGSIVATSVVALGFGVAAVATPHWHYTDTEISHMRRGLFSVCSVQNVDGYMRYDCKGHPPSAPCGQSYASVRNRFVWPPLLAVLSLVVLLLIPLGATCSWFLFRPRPKTLLAITTAALICMLTAMTVHVHTMDDWYFCEREFCNYFQAVLLNTETVCLSGLGYSFMLACLYCAALALIMVLCALYARWIRSGAIVDTYEQRQAAKRGDSGKSKDDKAKAAKAKKALAAERELDDEDEATYPQRTRAAPPRRGQQQPQPQTRYADPYGRPADDDDGYGGASNGDGRRQQQQMPDAAAEAGDDDQQDWLFDEEAGMYWSDFHGLYLDPRTNFFYDPQSDCWHDPERDEWYRVPAWRGA